MSIDNRKVLVIDNALKFDKPRGFGYDDDYRNDPDYPSTEALEEELKPHSHLFMINDWNQRTESYMFEMIVPGALIKNFKYRHTALLQAMVNIAQMTDAQKENLAGRPGAKAK
jgi:hypothetical protein